MTEPIQQNIPFPEFKCEPGSLSAEAATKLGAAFDAVPSMLPRLNHLVRGPQVRAVWEEAFAEASSMLSKALADTNN